MAPVDRRMSPNFRLSEFRLWDRATEAEVAKLQETVDQVLQPVRDRWGFTIPTSWIYWSSGVRRTGSHNEGGTVDFVTTQADLRDVFRWGVDELLPRGYIGRWIYEPDLFDDDGRRIQGEHIHVAPRSDMLAAFGKGDVGAFVETSQGVYEPVAGTAFGAYGDPIELPGIVVTVSPRYGLALILAALGLYALQERTT